MVTGRPWGNCGYPQSRASVCRSGPVYHPGMKSSPHPTQYARRMRWLLMLPKLGIVLLLAAVLALLWLLHRNEVDEERNALIKDVLWLEQNVRFHLTGTEEHLQQLALELASRPAGRQLFRLRAENLLRNNPELKQILWLDTAGRPLDALPSAQPSEGSPTSGAPSLSREAYENALGLGKRTYSQVYLAPDRRGYFEVAVPIFVEGKAAGLLVGVYPVDALLKEFVPWWFAEKYLVQVVDDNDVLYGAKSNVQGKPGQAYELPLDPPGYSVKLRVLAYQSSAAALPRLLAAAIVLLAAGVFWSLWAVRGLMQKRLAAEEALGTEHAFRQAMEDSLTVGMRARDLEGRVIYVNPAFCHMTGFAPEELLGRLPPMPYWLPDMIDETLALHRAVLAGEAPADGFELSFRRKNGEIFHALIYEAPLIDARGHHTGWMGSVLDITERKRSEELARQQQEALQFTARLVTMGEMASTLAHELNQPLSAIASYNAGCLNLLEDGKFDAGEFRYALEKVGVQAQRAGRIVRRVHDFVKKSEPRRAPCNLGEVIAECVGFIEIDARKREVTLESRIADIPPLLADRLMLEQVLLNLLRNGMDAMAETPPELRHLCISATVEGDEAVVRVADNGCGISEAVREKLFTAFFSTKPQGMGVGLSICRSIVEFHRGRLWADPNLDSPTGSGTHFTFTLPLESP